jgi:hypothetical protein
MSKISYHCPFKKIYKYEEKWNEMNIAAPYYVVNVLVTLLLLLVRDTFTADPLNLESVQQSAPTAKVQ